MIRVSHEHKRGCGYRKPGGFYFVSSGLGEPCGKLPLSLECCPHCGTGVKVSRGFTWIDVTPFAKSKPCCLEGPDCNGCPLGGSIPEKAGLLWVGNRFYPSPEDFAKEAKKMGVSRRIKAIPHHFKIGETWIFLAHIKTPDLIWKDLEIKTGKAIFHAFVPTAVEYVVTGKETEDELTAIEDRGIDLVEVRPIAEDPKHPSLL